MKSIRMAGTLVLAAIAVCAASTSEAVAASPFPEIGRCQAVTPVEVGTRKTYNGAYANSGCTKLNSRHKGRYEWSSGPGPKPQFTGTSAVEPEPLLETVGGGKVSCMTMTYKGEYTGPKTAKVTSIVFTGCGEGNNKPCQNTFVKEGEIESLGELTGELGVTKGGTTPVAGWDLKREGAIFSYECGTKLEVHDLQTVEGSVIAPVLVGAKSNLNRMNTKSILTYKQSGGLQAPEMFEGGPKDVLKTTTVVGTSKTVEQTGLRAIETLETQEPYEIRTHGEVPVA